MTMRERIKSAFIRAYFGPEKQSEDWADQVADAVLDAMREPTEKMGMAAFNATSGMGDETSLAEEYLAVWQAMIDAAKEEA